MRESNLTKIILHEKSGREITVNIDGKDENTLVHFATATFLPECGVDHPV